ncbi:MAG: preprotein translocase subunit YajC [Gammaproteobacteria bacterium]|nr:preprotein translocase subunit YajC [Gammaproteobacteria bacterium]
MDFFIASAHANPAAAQGSPTAGWDLIFMLVIFGLIFYFMIYRPQAKRVKEHKALMSSISKGDEVLTQGGLLGRVAKVADDKDYVVIEVADNTQVMVQKSAISAVLPKGTLKSL